MYTHTEREGERKSQIERHVSLSSKVTGMLCRKLRESLEAFPTTPLVTFHYCSVGTILRQHFSAKKC